MTSGRLAYMLFMLLAAVVFLLVRRLQPQPAAVAGLPRRTQLALLSAAFVGGMIGAKLPFVASGGWLGDGKTITTALAGAYLAVEAAKWALQVRVKTGDAWALPAACGLAVGRWGCFFNGCCYGNPTRLPWAWDFGDGQGRHPTQIYEFLFHAAMAAVIVWLMRRNLLSRQRLKLYLIAYALFRFGTEWLRPAPPSWLGLTFYQWVSLALIAGLACQWWYDAQWHEGGTGQRPVPETAS